MRIQQRLGVLITCALLTALALAAQNTPAPPPKTDAATTSTAPTSSTPQPVNSGTYMIGPTDWLRIEVWQAPDFSMPQVLVQPDGKFRMHLIGDVQAEGLTPARLEAQLTEALKTYIKDPDVTVYVLQINSKSYSVNGAVGRPGKFPLVHDITVYDAINEAGGFREPYAKKKKVIILRGKERIPFNAVDYVNGKNLDKNILLQNNDSILVQE